MDRRTWMQSAGLGAGLAGLNWVSDSPPPALAGRGDREPARPPAPARPRGLPALKITDVKAILTAPAGIRLVVVKVQTSEPGLYGLGCATFTQRARVVETAVDRYLR